LGKAVFDGMTAKAAGMYFNLSDTQTHEAFQEMLGRVATMLR